MSDGLELGQNTAVRRAIMSRPTFSSILKATTLRLLRERPLLCAAGLVIGTGSAVYFYNRYYGVGEDEPATVEIVDRVVTVEEGTFTYFTIVK